MHLNWNSTLRTTLGGYAIAALVACGGGNDKTNVAPTSVALSSVSSTAIGTLDVTWQAASDDSTPVASLKYQVHLSTTADFVPSASTLKFEGGNVLTTQLTDLTPGTAYTVRLVVLDQDGAATVSAAQTITIARPKLPDTGITAAQCYATGSNTLVSCTSPEAIALNAQQDGMLTPGSAGLSYSAVPNPSGGSYDVTECVKDNLTGLTWEGKPTSGQRAASNTYANYDSTTSAQAWNGSAYVNPTQAQIYAATNSVGYVAAVNATKLCGYTDWRLPTADELQSIVDYSVAYPGPSINTTWFPNTVPGDGRYGYWISSPVVGFSNFSWYVSFGNGGVYSYVRNYALPVRLVRSS